MSTGELDRQHVQGDWSWRAYDRWNAAIAEEFFTGSFGGKPVYLDLEEDVLRRAAERAGEGNDSPRDRLVAAVVPTLFIRNPSILFKAHLSRLDSWDLLGPPPCVAVLGLLSLAAESMASDGELRETNYYGRLMQLIGLDPTDHALRNQVARAFREQSHPLWDRLARWMSGRPSVRGLPTAQPLGRLTHVGLPISQALIRAADRDALHELFADRDLQPGQEVSTRDMATLLRDWLPQGRASTGLRRLCASDDSLDKVAEVACHELRSWRGAFDEATRGRASVQARISKHPRRRLRLSLLLTSMPPDATTAAVRSTSEATTHSGVVQADTEAQFGGEVEAGVRELAIDIGALGSLLSGPLSVRAGNAVATRSPRPLVVLVYDELANAYREAPRARLAVPLLVLAPVALSGAVAAAISDTARPGFIRRRAEDLEGIPDGWDLFEQVLLLGRPRDLSSDLDQLVPSGSTQLSVVGGVRLPPGRAWLASRAPEVCVSNEDGPELRLTLSAENALTGAREEVGGWMVSETPLLSLTDLDLPSGRYEARVAAASDDRAIHHHTFSLVTPESATPVEEWLAHDLSQPWGALAAEPVVGAMRPLRGANLESDGHHVTPPTLESASKPTQPQAEKATEAGCPEYGHHHFVRQTARLISGSSSVWVCSRCGVVRAEMPARRSPAVVAKGGVAPPLSGDAGSPEQALDLDALLEAASALGSGRHETLLGLIDRLDEIAGDGRRLIELLSALGHIDIARDSRWLRPQRWSVAPTTIAVGAFGAFLTGWRSEGLIHRLGRLAHDLGGRVRSVAQPLAPSRVAIEGLDSEGLELVALEANGSTERDMAVVLHPGPRLASRLPTLREIRQTLTSVEPRWTSRTESMDPRTGRWRPGGKPQALGSFRRDTPAGRFYWHFDGVDGRQVDWKLARWLGLREGPPLISWDAHEESLACHLSCPLPPLFERAAVLCSGIPPSRRGGSLVFSGVDRETAYTLIQRLTSDRAKDAVGIL